MKQSFNKFIKIAVPSFAIAVLIAIMLYYNSLSREYSMTFFAMDTVMSITAYGPHAEEGLNEAQKEIVRLEKLFSINDAGSIIYEINHSDGKPVSIIENPNAYELINEALKLSAETDGAFDISIYPLIKAWGFTEDEFRVPDDGEIKEILEHVDYCNITISESEISVSAGSMLDLGAIAKGYAADAAAMKLKEAGVSRALINLGGNIYVMGQDERKEDWVIGIKNPLSEADILGKVKVKDKAVVTSGNYERFFEKEGKRYWHILDPKTGYPADAGIVSATIVADSSTLADALSTACFVMGADKTRELYEKIGGFEYILVGSDGRVISSDNINFEK